jgi:uncharacterized protein
MSTGASKLTSRVREILRGGQGSPPADAPVAVGSNPPSPVSAAAPGAAAAGPREVGARLADSAARTLGGCVVETPRGPCVVVDRVYPPAHRHGLLVMGECVPYLGCGAPGFAMLAGAASAEPSRATQPTVFLDLETTGLAGGAGTYAFLVGCAWFEGEAFRVRQFFMVGHALERALLGEVRACLDEAAAIVTYNGRSFDVPLLETRYLYHRESPPFGERPHLDMLHPARRLWRYARPVVAVPGLQTDRCALSVIEQVLFGAQRTGDVPGFEIPGRYFAFLRSADASPLEPVLEHNRLDLLSLAAVTARAVRLLERGAEAASQPRECYGLGRLLERVGHDERAEACYRQALAMTEGSWQSDDEVVRAEVLRVLAVRCRRAGRHGEAAQHWQALTTMGRCPPGVMREALEALAIHHEHRARDLEQARLFAERTRQLSAGTRYASEVEQRLARLRRKMGEARTAGPRPDAFWQ